MIKFLSLCVALTSCLGSCPNILDQEPIKKEVVNNAPIQNEENIVLDSIDSNTIYTFKVINVVTSSGDNTWNISAYDSVSNSICINGNYYDYLYADCLEESYLYLNPDTTEDFIYDYYYYSGQIFTLMFTDFDAEGSYEDVMNFITSLTQENGVLSCIKVEEIFENDIPYQNKTFISYISDWIYTYLYSGLPYADTITTTINGVNITLGQWLTTITMIFIAVFLLILLWVFMKWLFKMIGGLIK